MTITPGILKLQSYIQHDNGSQYKLIEFSKLSKAYGFQHKTSSPRYPQVNGEAEQAVKTVKQLLSKYSDPYVALLTYRASPLNNGHSPSELLMGRRLRTTVPVLPEVLKPKWPDKESVNKYEEKQKMLQKKVYNYRHRATPLKPLQKGDEVWISDCKSYGTVLQQTGQP